MTTKCKLVTSLGFSIGCLTAIAAMPTAHAEMGAWGTELVTNGPRINRGDGSGPWAAQHNVRDSQRYDAVLNTNPNFRAKRMQKECGPIDDRQLRDDCLASFGRYEGSSLPRGGDRDNR